MISALAGGLLSCGVGMSEVGQRKSPLRDGQRAVILVLLGNGGVINMKELLNFWSDGFLVVVNVLAV